MRCKTLTHTHNHTHTLTKLREKVSESFQSQDQPNQNGEKKHHQERTGRKITYYMQLGEIPIAQS